MMYLLMAGNGLLMRLATLSTTVNVVFITFARDRYARGHGMSSDRTMVE